jgi:hypothetical protein
MGIKGWKFLPSVSNNVKYIKNDFFEKYWSKLFNPQKKCQIHMQQRVYIFRGNSADDVYSLKSD